MNDPYPFQSPAKNRPKYYCRISVAKLVKSFGTWWLAESLDDFRYDTYSQDSPKRRTEGLAAMNGWENVLKNDGVTIAIAGMAVVFSALIVISLFISLLPHALKQLHRIAPEREEHHAPAPLSGSAPVSEDQAIAAAVGYAMYLQAQRAK